MPQDSNTGLIVTILISALIVAALAVLAVIGIVDSSHLEAGALIGPLTPAMRRGLHVLNNGGHGGRLPGTVTRNALMSRGLIDDDGAVTPAGRRVIETDTSAIDVRDMRAGAPFIVGCFYVMDRYASTPTDALVSGPFATAQDADTDRRERNIGADCDVYRELGPREPNPALEALRRNVSGKVASGEAEPIVNRPAVRVDRLGYALHPLTGEPMMAHPDSRTVLEVYRDSAVRLAIRRLRSPAGSIIVSTSGPVHGPSVSPFRCAVRLMARIMLRQDRLELGQQRAHDRYSRQLDRIADRHGIDMGHASVHELVMSEYARLRADSAA